MPLDTKGTSAKIVRRHYSETHSYIESLEPIAGGRAKRENLGTSVRDTDLEVTISVFLFEDETYGFFNIYEESAWGRTTLFVVGHPTWPEVPIVLEHRTLGSEPTRLSGFNIRQNH